MSRKSTGRVVTAAKERQIKREEVPEREVVLGFLGQPLHPSDDVDPLLTKIGGRPVSLFIYYLFYSPRRC